MNPLASSPILVQCINDWVNEDKKCEMWFCLDEFHRLTKIPKKVSRIRVHLYAEKPAEGKSKTIWFSVNSTSGFYYWGKIKKDMDLRLLFHGYVDRVLETVPEITVTPKKFYFTVEALETETLDTILNL